MYVDLERAVRTDGAFANKLMHLCQKLDHHTRLADRQPQAVIIANQTLAEINRLCQDNPFFLAGWYFPNFEAGKRLSFYDFPFVFPMLGLQIGGYTVIRGSRQIGKSIGFSARQILNAYRLHGFRSMYICPKFDQLKTYMRKLRSTERAFRFFRPNSDYANNLAFKEYANGATIELAHVDTTPDNVRGKTCDELLIDEFQNFDPDMLVEVEQVQAASTRPVTIYAGTSLTTDSALEGVFQQSSQGILAIRCHCGRWNIPLEYAGVMDMITADGPVCASCRSALNVRTAEFIHQYPSKMAEKKLGFHVPQIFVPFVVENKARWFDKVWSLAKDPRQRIKFMQECLGIATEEGTRELSRRHLEAICILGDPQALLRKALNREYRYVVSGCDWGGTNPSIENKTRVSTTVHIMLGIPPGTDVFDIIYMQRYEGMDYEAIADDIVRNHLKYGGHTLGCDTGVGAAYIEHIRKRLPVARNMLFTYGGPREPLIQLPGTACQQNEWRVNKTDSITQLFNAIKAKRIRCYNWDIAEPHLSDFLNIFRAVTDMPGGSSTLVFKGSATKPNDMLMGCNYAFLIGRMLLRERLCNDNATQAQMDGRLFGSMSFGQGGMPFNGGALSG